MYQTVLNILQTFFAVWSVYIPFSDGVTLFKDDVTDIDALKAKQQQILKGYAITKRNKKKSMANIALDVCKKIRGYASDVGNTTLFNNLRISFTKLFRSPDNDAISYAELIYTAATELSDAEKLKYKVSDADILALRTAITDFQDVPSPEQMKKVKKTFTKDLSLLFDKTTGVLTNKLDNLINEFRVSNPDLYAQYKAGRRTYTSHRHTTIEGDTVDATTGEDLSAVKVLIESPDGTFEDMTNIQGYFKRKIEPEINYKIKFILDEYEIEEFENVNLNRGEHERLKVKMKKITP